VELHRAIRAEDSTFVSRTTLVATSYSPQQIVVLRSVTVNPLTTRAVIEEILEKHEKLGHQIFNNNYRLDMDGLLKDWGRKS